MEHLETEDGVARDAKTCASVVHGDLHLPTDVRFGSDDTSGTFPSFVLLSTLSFPVVTLQVALTRRVAGNSSSPSRASPRARSKGTLHGAGRTFVEVDHGERGRARGAVQQGRPGTLHLICSPLARLHWQHIDDLLLYNPVVVCYTAAVLHPPESFTPNSSHARSANPSTASSRPNLLPLPQRNQIHWMNS